MNMKTLVWGVAALTLMSTAWASEEPVVTAENEQPAELTEDEESPLTFEISVDVLSDYVFRGFIYNDNPVWQPGVTIDYETEDFGGFYANIWSSFDLTHKRGYCSNSRRSCGVQEIDYTLAYYVNLFGFDFEAGHAWYTYPNGNGPSEREIFASVSYENPFITPTFAAYWLYGGVDGTDRSTLYYNASLEHEFEIGDSFAITPYASLGFGGNAWCHYMVDDERGFDTELTDQTVGLKAAYQVTEWMSIGAQINYTWLPSRTLRRGSYMCGNGYNDDEGTGGKNQLCWGGVNMTFTF